MQTENENTARLYAQMISRVYDVETSVCSGGSSRVTWRAEVPSEADRLRILASVDFGIYEGAINSEMFSRECCAACFIRGAFLACGHLTDPEKEYRVDFPVKDIKLARELVSLMEKNYISANISTRGSGYVVYIKRSEMVVNLLTLMGASMRSLELIETTIIKGVKNNMNRARNCDSGNIGRTVEASIAQRRAIDALEAADRLGSLPPELFSAAQLRRDNPEASLKELCRLSPEPITVSGLNHRLKRIIEIYNDMKK